MKFIDKKAIFTVFFIFSPLFFTFPIIIAQEGEEWKAPEVPKTEAERSTLEKEIQKRQQAIDHESAGDPRAHLENQRLKADIAVLEISKAEDKLKANPNDATAQAQKVEAQKLLAQAQQAFESSFVPSEAVQKRTVLQQFAYDFNQQLTKSLNDIKESLPNEVAIQRSQYLALSNEFNRMQLGRQSTLLADVDYSVTDFARQKEILQKFQQALVDNGLDSPQAKTLQENIEARIEEIKAFKPGPEFRNNKLAQELNVANKLPSDRLLLLKDRLRPETFNATYKEASDRQQALRDLKQILLLYGISFKEFFALNSTVTPAFINSIALSLPNDSERIGLFSWVLNDALSVTTYAEQERRLKYLDAALQDPSLHEYKGLADYIRIARDAIAKRITQIEAVKRQKVPVPPAGSLAEKLQLNEKIPADQIVAIENEFVSIQSQIMDVFKEQRQFANGDNIFAWEEPELKKLQEIVNSMRGLLIDASKLYDLDEEYQARFIAMNDPITALQVQVNEALDQPSIAETVYNDVSSFLSTIFSGKTGLEEEEPSKSMAETIGQTLDSLNKVVDTMLRREGELMKIISGGAKVVGDYLEQAPEVIESTQKFLADLEQNTNAHRLGKANLWIIEQAGTIEDRQAVANLVVSAFKELQNFAHSDVVKKIAEGIQSAGQVFNGFAEAAKEVGNKIDQAAQDVTPPDEALERKLEAIKTAQALIDKEKEALPVVSETDVQTYSSFFKDFFQKMLSWLRTKFTTPKTGLNDRYVAAMNNYTTQRDLYLRYLGVTDESTSEEIRAAMEKKFREDKNGSKKAAGDVFTSARDMMAVLQEAQKTLQAVQGNIHFVVEAWDSLDPAATDEKASAAQIIIDLFAARDRKLDYLEAARREMAFLESGLRAMIPKNIKNISVVSDDFITISMAANKLYLSEQQIKTIQDYQALIKELDDALNKKQQELLQSQSGGTNTGGNGGIFGGG